MAQHTDVIALDAARGDARTTAPLGVTIPRRFTRPGQDVYASLEWELRSARISNERGETIFEQTDCEIPKS